MINTIFYTFYIAFGSTIIALAIGLPTAFFIARRNFFLRKILLSFTAVPLAIPALIVALGYVSVFGMNGIVNRILMSATQVKDTPVTFLYSSIGVIICQGFYNFPLVALIVSDGWSKLTNEQQEAARIYGANERQVFFHVTLPDLSASIAAGAIPVFLYSFNSFLIVLLFGSNGGTTLEVEIYRAVKVTLDFQRAATLAVIETVCSLGTVFLYCNFMRKFSQNQGIDFSRTASLPKIGKAPFMTRQSKLFECVAFAALMTLVSIFFVMPFVGIAVNAVRDANSVDKVVKIFSSKQFHSAIFGTLKIAPLAALLSCTIAFVLAVILRSVDPNGNNAFFQTLPFLPMAISSVVLGYIMIRLQVRHSYMTLILAETFLAVPIAFRQIYAAISKIPEELIDITKIFSRSRFDIIFYVYLPLCRTAIFSAFGFSLALSIGDTTLPLIISVPRLNTIALYTYRLASNYRYSQACACGTVIFLTCVLIFSLLKKLDETEG